MKTSVKRIGAAIALLGVTASLAGCGGGNTNTVEPGTVNTNTDQTEFNIISGISALSGGEQMGTAGIGKDQDYNIYTIPQYSMINKAWLDELGLQVPPPWMNSTTCWWPSRKMI